MTRPNHKLLTRANPAQIQRQWRHRISATVGNYITPRFQQATAFVASGTSVNHVRRRVCGKANFMQMPAAAFAGNEKRTRMPFTLDRGLSPRLLSSSANIRACGAYQPFITTILVIVQRLVFKLFVSQEVSAFLTSVEV